ncbi:MAG: hypothetical protein QM756_38730 [Polyangiaceae bacterium]
MLVAAALELQEQAALTYTCLPAQEQQRVPAPAQQALEQRQLLGAPHEHTMALRQQPFCQRACHHEGCPPFTSIRRHHP